MLSTTILIRLQKLLDRLERRFELTQADLSAPRGQVNWTEYATVKLPRADFLSVPCRFPDLRDDRELKGAIHVTLRKLAGRSAKPADSRCGSPAAFKSLPGAAGKSARCPRPSAEPKDVEQLASG